MFDERFLQDIGHSFTWKIENFLSNICRWNEPLISPTFTVEFFPCVKWCLRMHTATTPGYISCYLRRVIDDGRTTAVVGFKISLADKDLPYFTSQKHSFLHDRSHGQEKLWKWKTLLQKKDSYFPEGSFTVRCHLWPCFIQKIILSECLALTHIEVEKTSFEKSIHGFSTLVLGHKTEFSVPFNSQFNFTIRIEKISQENITLDILKCDEHETRDVLLICRLSLLDSDGIPARDPKEKKHVFKGNENELWKFLPFLKVQKSKENADTLNLKFQLSLSSGKMASRILETNFVPFRQKTDDRKLGVDSLSRDLEAFFLQERSPDVTLRSGNETISAHKAILSARSPVFAAMFDTDMVEKESGVVDIIGIDASTLNLLVTFMYSGRIELKEGIASKLLIAADRYQVLTLKDMCTTFLKQNITVRNACQILALADSHQVENLKKSVEEFIWRHRFVILSSDEWEIFTMENIMLASDILRKISKRYLSG